MHWVSGNCIWIAMPCWKNHGPGWCWKIHNKVMKSLTRSNSQIIPSPKTNMTIENPPFADVFPIENGEISQCHLSFQVQSWTWKHQTLRSWHFFGAKKKQAVLFETPSHPKKFLGCVDFRAAAGCLLQRSFFFSAASTRSIGPLEVEGWREAKQARDTGALSWVVFRGYNTYDVW